LRAGKRVATNCDVFLEHLMPERDKAVVMRVPDKPSPVDLYMIGSGNRFVEFEPILKYSRDSITALAPAPRLLAGFDEMHNGALVLDECGSWLNTRNFQDKGRAEMLEWAIHARKYGWDVFFIMQNISQVDKQLRDSLLEYVVRLNRLDRMKVPVVSGALKLLTAGATEGNLPRVHIGVVRLGPQPDGLVADRWVFRGDDLNRAYNTTQVFSDTYPHGTHSLLSAWHLSCKTGVPADFVGPVRSNGQDDVLLRVRALPPKPLSKHMNKYLTVAVLIGCVIGVFGSRLLLPQHAVQAAVAASGAEHEFSDKVKIVGMIRSGTDASLTLSDGRVVNALSFKVRGAEVEAQIPGGVWVKGNL
jgi:hypothetical protein